MTRTDWRLVERKLIRFFASHLIHMGDVAGMPVLEVVRYREVSEIDETDEITIASLSLEHLAKHLAEEFEIPA
jgi:hypothetical protein